MSISSHDWVYKNEYQNYLKDHNFLNICYLLDNENYGKYEKWHENGTVWLRANKFLYDILNEKDRSKLEDFDVSYTPPLVLFDKEGNSLLEFRESNCYNPDFEECKKSIENLFEEIEKVIDKKL